VAMEVGRTGMAVMVVDVFPGSVYAIPHLTGYFVLMGWSIAGRVPVRMQVLMEMGMDVYPADMFMLMLMAMTMGVLVSIPAVMVILLFHGYYFSLLICTSSDRYSALSASVV
jgi:hypothetical protein